MSASVELPTSGQVWIRPSVPPPRRVRPGWPLIVLALALLGVALWGAGLQRAGHDLTLHAPPFYAPWEPRLGWGAIPLVVMGCAVAISGPRVARALSWRSLLLVVWLATTAWSVALAASTGWGGLTRAPRSQSDYVAVLPTVRRVGLARFVHGYVAQLHRAPVHVKGHPPGMVVILRVLELIGLRGHGWLAAVIIGTAATVPVGVGLVVRTLAGEAPARALLPFMVCGPWTLLAATVADSFFAATVVWGTALLASSANASRRRIWVTGACAGAVLGFAIYLSYGLVPLVGLLAASVVVATRRVDVVPPLLIGATGVALTWTMAGFWWPSGLDATRHFYRVGAAADRPYSYFLVANLVVFAVMLGPAAVTALVVRSRPGPRSPSGPARPAGLAPSLWWLVGASLLAVAVADLSGLSKGEVERIWVPFLPFASVAMIRLAQTRCPSWWIGAQAGTAIVLQLALAWPW